ncbi:hypothetical protein [Pseudomonas piscis]
MFDPTIDRCHFILDDIQQLHASIDYSLNIASEYQIAINPGRSAGNNLKSRHHPWQAQELVDKLMR